MVVGTNRLAWAWHSPGTTSNSNSNQQGGAGTRTKKLLQGGLAKWSKILQVSTESSARPPPQSIRKSLILQHWGSYKATMKVAIVDRCRRKCLLSTETCLYICQSSWVQPPETIFRSLMMMSAVADATCTMARKGLIATIAGVWVVICRPESGPNYMSKQVCDATKAYLKTRRE